MFDAPEPYRGPFVVLQPDPLGYRVSIDPPIDDVHARTYREKHDAWGYARDLWTALKLPLRDLTDGNAARPVHPGPPRKNSCSL
jgi:hypothetical protein